MFTSSNISSASARPLHREQSASITKTNHTNVHRAGVHGKRLLFVEFELKLECDKYQYKPKTQNFIKPRLMAIAQLHADKRTNGRTDMAKLIP